MNLVLHWCWKEWRAQRGILAAYLLLALGCLCLGYLLAPEASWQRDGNRVHVLAIFFGVGVVGVLAFAAPQLVRGEYTVKDDLFVRRLPGALRAAFGGKLLFLLLCALALPLIALLVGEVYLQATGHFWDDLYLVTHNSGGVNEVRAHWPELGLFAGLGLVAVPWVWVLATWLPGARMALGGTALLFLLLGVAVFAVLRQCPGLDGTIDSWHWLWPVWPLGIAIAAISWLRGRRGGGNARSARIGLAALGIALAPPAGWLGSLAHEYHHPDLQHLADVRLCGISPDQRFVLGNGAARAGWAPVPVRFDLQTGAVEQLGSVHTWFDPELLRPYGILAFSVQRYWRLGDEDSGRQTLLDLQSGARMPVSYDPKSLQIRLPAELMAAIDAEARERSRLRAPDDRRAWAVGRALHVEQQDGAVAKVAWPGGPQSHELYPAGHGISIHDNLKTRLFDLTRLCEVTPAAANLAGIAVGTRWLLHRSSGKIGWQAYDPDRGSMESRPELERLEDVMPIDGERLLMLRRDMRSPAQLYVYRLGDRSLQELQLPAQLTADRPTNWYLACGSRRDRQGRIWLGAEVLRKVSPFEVEQCGYFALDPATLRLGPLPLGGCRPLAFVGERQVLAYGPDRSLLRIDCTTGERTVLFQDAEVWR